MKSIFASLILVFSFTISTSHAQNEMGFLCSVKDGAFGGYFSLDAKIEGFMVKTETGAVLENYDFEYRVMDEDDIWSQATVSVATELANYANYRPRVYKEHYKFDLSKGVFGTVSFLVPFDAFSAPEDRFEAVLIMSNIDDHAGDTVRLSCSID
jgi:hypothetical protein